jgi:hypothetical protein
MASRKHLIEQIRRVIYNGQPTDDSNITDNLINIWISQGVAVAAKQNYTDNIKLEGVGFINNTFSTTFKGLAVTNDEEFLWKATIPDMPVGVGRNEGITRVRFKSGSKVGIDAIPLSSNQTGYQAQMRAIPNKILYYYEGNILYALSTLNLDSYTVSMTMVSGGDSTDLTSELNVPNDYIPIILKYAESQWLLEKNQPVDGTNDGVDKANLQ